MLERRKYGLRGRCEIAWKDSGGAGIILFRAQSATFELGRKGDGSLLRFGVRGVRVCSNFAASRLSSQR